MEKRRKKFFGKPESDLGDRKYTYHEAVSILGPCQRKTVQYGCVDEVFCEESTNIYEEPVPAGWYKDHNTEIIFDEYDVWINKRGNALLAIPLP